MCEKRVRPLWPMYLQMVLGVKGEGLGGLGGQGEWLRVPSGGAGIHLLCVNVCIGLFLCVLNVICCICVCVSTCFCACMCLCARSVLSLAGLLRGGEGGYVNVLGGWVIVVCAYVQSSSTLEGVSRILEHVKPMKLQRGRKDSEMER